MCSSRTPMPFSQHCKWTKQTRRPGELNGIILCNQITKWWCASSKKQLPKPKKPTGLET